MTLALETCRVEYTAAASQTIFPYPFLIFAATDLLVYQNGSLLTTSQYSVSGVGAAGGGNVTLNAPASASDELIIVSGIGYTQDAAYVAGDAFPATSHETALDRQTRMIQQLKHITDRCLQLSQALSFGLTGLELPAPSTLTLVASGKKYLSWNDAEDNLTLREIAAADDAVGLLSSSVDNSTQAGLPAAGTAGRVRRLSDSTGGLTLDDGTEWISAHGNIYDVRLLGVRLGVDQTTEIQAVLDSVPASGGVVYFPDGTYVTTSALIPKANTVLLGAGRFQSIIQLQGATGRVINTNGNDSITIRDLQIDGFNAPTTAHQGVAFLNGSNNCTIENCYIRRCGQYGILVGDTGTEGSTGSNGAEGHVIRGNLVDMTGADGAAAPAGIILFPKGNTAGYIANSGALVEGNEVITDSASLNGIKYQFQRGGRVVGNFIKGVTSTSSPGALDILQCHSCIIANNHVERSYIGIVFNGEIKAGTTIKNDYNIFEGNTVKDFDLFGTHTSLGFDGFIFRGNMIDANPVANRVGIRVEVGVGGSTVDYRNVVIDGNTLFKCGIYLSQSTTSSSYRELIIRNNAIHTSPDDGIRVQGADQILVADNFITEPEDHGIYLGPECDNAQVHGNYILNANTANGASGAGITLDGGNNYSVHDNYIHETGGGNTKYGLFLRGSTEALDQVQLSGNRILGATVEDIHVAGTFTSGYPVMQRMWVDNAAATTPADTSENTVSTVTIPKGAFTHFSGVRVVAFGECELAGGTKDLKLYFGATQIGSTLTISTGSVAWRFEAEVVIPDQSPTAQHSWVKSYEAATLENSTYQSSSVNTITGSVEIKVTGTKVSGADTIRSRCLLVELFA